MKNPNSKKKHKKQARIYEDLHKHLKNLAFNNDVYMEELVSQLLIEALRNKELVTYVLTQLRKRSS